MNKPKCNCGKEMKVIEFLGYYDEFKYFALADDCTCNINVDELEHDEQRIPDI